MVIIFNNISSVDDIIIIFLKTLKSSINIPTYNINVIIVYKLVCLETFHLSTLSNIKNNTIPKYIYIYYKISIYMLNVSIISNSLEKVTTSQLKVYLSNYNIRNIIRV